MTDQHTHIWRKLDAGVFCEICGVNGEDTQRHETVTGKNNEGVSRRRWGIMDNTLAGALIICVAIICITIMVIMGGE